jgi:hypothetical protein
MEEFGLFPKYPLGAEAKALSKVFYYKGGKRGFIQGFEIKHIKVHFFRILFC